MSVGRSKLMSTEFSDHISIESYKKINDQVTKDIADSQFMNYIATENFSAELAIEYFSKELQVSLTEAQVAQEFALFRIVKTVLIKMVNYFDKIRIDITSVEKLYQLEKLIKMNMRLYRVKTTGKNYDDYRGMLIVVPNGYSGTNMAATIETSQRLLEDSHAVVDNRLKSMSNLLAVYIQSLSEDKTPNVNFNYKKELDDIKSTLKNFENRINDNFKASTGKNNDKLEKYIDSFSDMDSVYNNIHKLIHFMRSMDLYKLNKNVADVHTTVVTLMDKLDAVDEAVYINIEKDIQKLSDVLFSIAKLVEMFSVSYYRNLTIVGNVDNALEFLSRKL